MRTEKLNKRKHENQFIIDQQQKLSNSGNKVDKNERGLHNDDDAIQTQAFGGKKVNGKSKKKKKTMPSRCLVEK